MILSIYSAYTYTIFFFLYVFVAPFAIPIVSQLMGVCRVTGPAPQLSPSAWKIGRHQSSAAPGRQRHHFLRRPGEILTKKSIQDENDDELIVFFRNGNGLWLMVMVDDSLMVIRMFWREM